MFQLHDRTRRRIALGLFGLLALLPTLLVLVWAVWLRLPAYVQAETDRLGQQLGLKVSILAIHPQTPTKTLYEGVQLCDAESGRPILYCGQLQAQWRAAQNDAQGDPLPTLVLSANDLKLDITHKEPAWLLLERVLARRTGWGDLDVQIQTPQLMLRTAQESPTLGAVQVRLQSTPANSQFVGSFRLSSEVDDPVRFWIVRNRKNEPPSLEFAFDTGKNQVPCSLLPTTFDLPSLLGAQSTVQGSLWMKQTPSGWSGGLPDPKVPLVLSNIDLERLVGSRFPHAWSGTGQLTLQSAAFADNRLQLLMGWLQGSEGEMSSSLLQAAVERLGLQSPAGALLQQPHVRYGQLCLGFQITEQGVVAYGPASKVILQEPRGPLLLSGDMQPRPTAALIQLLQPDGHVALPTAPPATWLLEHLPLPKNDSRIASRPTSPTASPR